MKVGACQFIRTQQISCRWRTDTCSVSNYCRQPCLRHWQLIYVQPSYIIRWAIRNSDLTIQTRLIHNAFFGNHLVRCLEIVEITSLVPRYIGTKDKTYSLTSTPKDRFLKNFFIANLFTLRVFASNLLRGSRRPRNTFCILFWYLAWGSNHGFTCNKPTHYKLGYGEFKNKY